MNRFNFSYYMLIAMILIGLSFIAIHIVAALF